MNRTDPTIPEIRRATIVKIAWAVENELRAASGAKRAYYEARDRALGMARIAADVLDLGMTEHEVYQRVRAAITTVGRPAEFIRAGDSREVAAERRDSWEQRIWAYYTRDTR